MTKNKVTGLSCAAAGIILTILSMQFSSKIQLNEPGPSLFPLIGSVGLIVCGAGIFLEKQKDSQPFLNREGWIRVGSLFGVMLLYVVLIKLLGFMVPMPLFLFVMIMILAKREKRPKAYMAAVVSVLVSAAIYYVFTQLLKVELPAGSLFQ
ncbi:tripartite tricarboxylate transporter TctB family protein [Caproiciproducens sp. NJN-50]|uniref:tripartite tricarboxylate transporter TctB family protein n=1 Tax=Acutalibacteraceae TaxID=3082771 RepID=UPI000FFE013F|nr:MULTISPECIES: tripartite tricarboxylate transporter TctB family protein [Acutalibacteraceae]QAT48743.1 tripartite tricarboxylate transporter TctB family protein [Caproiciproducens sp. NJN-50]